MMKKLSVLILLLAFPVSSTFGQKGKSDNQNIKEFEYDVVVLQHTGPDSNRVKLAYASDGYTSDEILTFPGHVLNSLNYLITPGLSVRPLPRYKNFINIYRIDLISKESGISIAPRYNQDKTKTVNNALGGTRDEDRLGWVDRQLAGALFSQAADRTGIKRFNWPFVVLNNPEYHNSGGRYVVFSYNFGKEIGLHEAGHGFFDLADEYYGDGTFEGDEPRNINVTADPDAKKWSHWIGYVDKDTLLGTIDVYEGAIYTSRGAYRPSKNSKMGWTSDRKPASFNAVCREKIILDIYDIVRPVDEAMDAVKIHKNPVNLWVRVVDPEVILVDWYVNDKLVLENGGTTVRAGDLVKKPGEYKVKAHAYDEVVKHAFSDNDNPHPLDLVRRDLDKLQQYVEWTVVID
ncbi:MAG: M64 family metallopeptidase [Bacteroidales bacterium]|nr:M64 family metallopeptidase [Bacteroidales bacterium]